MSRDVAVHWEVVVALGVFVWSMTEGALTFWGETIKDSRTEFFMLPMAFMSNSSTSALTVIHFGL